MASAETEDEITSLIGREVYTTNGVFVGDVEDLKLNLNEEVVKALALTNINARLFPDASGSKGVLIPFRWVRSVGDIILINNTVERLNDEDPESV